MLSIVGSLVAWAILGVHATGAVVFGLLERFGATDPEPLCESYRKQWGDPYAHAHTRIVEPGTYLVTLQIEDLP